MAIWHPCVKDYNKLGTFDYPIIADKGRDIATLYGMLDPDEKDSEGLPLTCRSLFIIGPDKRLKLQILYPASCGRNFEEVIRYGCQIFRLYVFGPSGLKDYGSATLRCKI